VFLRRYLSEYIRVKTIEYMVDIIINFFASIKEFTSIGSLYPEGTFVTGGLSKDRSAGG